MYNVAWPLSVERLTFCHPTFSILYRNVLRAYKDRFKRFSFKWVCSHQQVRRGYLPYPWVEANHIYPSRTSQQLVPPAGSHMGNSGVSGLHDFG